METVEFVVRFSLNRICTPVRLEGWLSFFIFTPIIDQTSVSTFVTTVTAISCFRILHLRNQMILVTLIPSSQADRTY